MSKARMMFSAVSKLGLFLPSRMRYKVLSLHPASSATERTLMPEALSRARRYSEVSSVMGLDCPTNLSKHKMVEQTNLTNGVGDTPAMVEPTKKLLAKAVAKAIDESGVSRNAWAASKRLDVKAVERVEKAAHNVGVDFMDRIARAIGVEPWQLIHPDDRYATLSELALEAARKLDAIKDPSRRARAYALWVQVVEFNNEPPQIVEQPRADGSSAPADRTPTPPRRRGPKKLP